MKGYWKEIGWLCYYHYIILIYIILYILISCFFFSGEVSYYWLHPIFVKRCFFQSGLLGSASPVQDTGRTNEDGGETGNDSLVMSVCLLNGLHNLGTWNGHWLWLFVPLSEKNTTFMTRPPIPGIAWNVVSMLSTSFNPILVRNTSRIRWSSFEYRFSLCQWQSPCDMRMSKGHVDRSSLLFYCHLQSIGLLRLNW